MKTRTQSLPEEFANSLSHGAALVAAVLAALFLLLAKNPPDDTPKAGAIIFALSMVLLYVSSTLYHALPHGRSKDLLLKLDHGAIFFFIAGSYTPFALAGPDTMGHRLALGLVWTLALAGAALKISNKISTPWLSNGLYLLMGWLVLVAAVPVVKSVSQTVFELLLYGGLAYSVGLVFFMLDSRMKYGHTVWHVFVAAGTGCHYFAVLGCTT